MKFQVTLFILFSLFLFCCQKQRVEKHPVDICSTLSNDSTVVRSKIEGKWKLEEYRSIDASGTITYEGPSSAGYSETLIIAGGTVKVYRNNKLETTFGLKIGPESIASSYPTDAATVYVYYDLIDGLHWNYFRVYICDTHLVLLQSYRSDNQSDIIYNRIF